MESKDFLGNGKAGKIVHGEAILTFREAFCSVAGGI